MLTPEWLESCPDRLVELYEQAERDIIADIARKLNSYDYFVSSAEWQAMKLQELNNTQKDIIDKLSKASGKTKTEIIKLLKEAGVKSLKYDTAKPTKATQNLLNTGLRRTLGSFDNLTRTTAINGTKQISEALDRAYMQVSTGAFSQEAAVKTAIKDLCRNGIETYRYPSHTDYIDVVVRRAVRTGINQTAAAISLSNAEQLNTDLVEVTAHSGARPSHAEWQGKVFSISGDSEEYEKLSEATGYGTVTGLCGANCRHTFHPFFEGDERMYSEEELAEMDAPKYEYNGEKLTEYEATQRQRYIERQIRRWKRENAAMKAAGLDTGESAAKVKHWGEIQADFIGQTGLKRQYGRENVITAGKTVDKSVQDGIIKTTKIANTKRRGVLPPAMDIARYERMTANLQKQGVTVIEAKKDDLSYLKALGAEATVCGTTTVLHMGKIPSASAFFEEVIHLQQCRLYGELTSTDPYELYVREILANRKLLKYHKAYGFQPEDVEDIVTNLTRWEKRFENLMGVDFNESGISRKI